jgi:hypothetical protein
MAKKDRQAFLELLYDMAGANEFKWFDFRVLGKQLGLDEQTAFNVSNYLAQEHLVKWQAIGGILGITHGGIKSVENSRLPPTSANPTRAAQPNVPDSPGWNNYLSRFVRWLLGVHVEHCPKNDRRIASRGVPRLHHR